MSEIAAVITYQRNAWGNNTGDMVQAKDINAVMNGN
jgi:cytochrome c oxidase subunit 2